MLKVYRYVVFHHPSKPQPISGLCRALVFVAHVGFARVERMFEDTSLCDKGVGLRKYEGDDKTAAYEHLRHCETRDDITGETLRTLAELVDTREFGEYSSERAEKP